MNEPKQGTFEEINEPTSPAPAVEVLQPERSSKKNEEEKLRTLQSLMGNLQMGWKISVYRSAPNWCRGHLETFEMFDTAQAIDIDYLTKRWGGQALHLKIHDEGGKWVGGGTVPLYTYPPMRRGQPITENQLLGFGEAPPPSPVPALSPTAPQNQIQQQAGFLGSLGMSLPDLLKMMSNGSKAETNVMLKLLERQLTAPQAPVAPAPAPAPMGQYKSPVEMFKEMMEMQTMMKDMAGMFGDGGGGGGDDSGMSGLLGTLAQTFMNRTPPQQQQQAPPPRRRRRRQQARVMPPPTQQTDQPTRPTDQHQHQQFENTDGSQNLSTLSDQFTDLSVEDGSDVLVKAFGNMPEEKRAASMQAVFNKLQGADVDDSSNMEETYSQDEFYDDEIPDENNFPPDSGGPAPTDAGDSPPDWDGDPKG